MEKILSKLKKVYLIGIGGIGMSGLAFLLKERGYIVSGSDIKESYTLAKLREQGIEVFLGHDPNNIKDVGLICFSSAVKEDNPEILHAKENNIPTVHRAQLLALISSEKKTIAVTGSHGKTTTTSLLGFVLSSLGYKPAVFVGGVPLNYDVHAWWGNEYFVIEADESDGSFLNYDPEVSIITNIDYEHLDYYKDMDALRGAFSKFARKTKGVVIGYGDDDDLFAILRDANSITYGFKPHNRVQARDLKFYNGFMNFDLVIDNTKERVRIPLLGEHNVLNALAVISFLFYQGQDLKTATKAIEGFKGVKRRLQIKEEAGGVIFMDDYAHHPTEIKSILKAVSLLKRKRIVVVFEPHRFSRVKLLLNDFANCFNLADEVIVTDVYSASEKELEGIDGKFLHNQIKKNCNSVQYISRDDLIESVPLCIQEGDIVLGLGAGDINILMDGIIDEFKKSRVKT